MTVDAMTRLFVGNGISLDTLRRQVRAQIGWVRVVNRQIVPRVTVTVDQLDLAVDEASRNEGQPEYLLSEIVLPVDNPSQAEGVGQDAGRLVQTLREGASFESLARQVSAAASAERGGDLGWIQSTTLPPELRDAMERLRAGEVSDPIPSTVGFHIFWLRDRRTTRPAVDSTRAAVEVALTQILFPLDRQADVAAIRAQAGELRARLVDCAAMVEGAAEVATPASGDLGWLRIGDLPPDLGQAVLNLPVGEVSPPLDGPGGIHLLMVCERRDPPALAPEREEIARRLQQERTERLARRYLRDLRKQAFVEVRL
jgi:peptidyl-prolyl cis-trans isomerase SurA